MLLQTLMGILEQARSKHAKLWSTLVEWTAGHVGEQSCCSLRGRNTTGWNGAAPARGALSGKLAERQGQDHKREADDGSEKAFLEWAR